MRRHEDCEDVVAINESPTTIGVADSSSTNEEIPSNEYSSSENGAKRVGLTKGKGTELLSLEQRSVGTER